MIIPVIMRTFLLQLKEKEYSVDGLKSRLFPRCILAMKYSIHCQFFLIRSLSIVSEDKKACEVRLLQVLTLLQCSFWMSTVLSIILLRKFRSFVYSWSFLSQLECISELYSPQKFIHKLFIVTLAVKKTLTS